MKKISSILVLLIILLTGCKEVKKQEIVAPQPELSILEKIAHAHGFENWKKVNELKFTFNVERSAKHFERNWIWNPKTNEVTAKSLGTEISYNRKTIDSISAQTDAAFINDKFWLLLPFQLVWDQNNFTLEHSSQATAPISKKSAQKLTIVYGSKGGYTPGDAYDIYFDENYLIQEWVYRKANTPEPSMTTTWENYITIEGMKFAQSHKKEGEDFNLHFTGIEVK